MNFTELFHYVYVVDDRNYYEMSSFVETRAERVMKNKATSAKFIQ